MAPTATVQTIADPYAGRLLETNVRLAKAGIYLLQISTLLVCLLPMAVGTWFAVTHSLRGSTEYVFSITIGSAVSLVAFFPLYRSLCQFDWPSKYMIRQLQSAIVERPDAIVDPYAPDAMLVEIIPRENWAKLMLDNADDEGLLLVDLATGELRLEADRRRYRIPAAAILSCELEMMTTGANESGTLQGGGLSFTLVVIRYDTEHDPEELVLAPFRTVAGESLGTSFRRRAEALKQLVDQLTAPSG